MLKLLFQDNPSKGIWLVGESLVIGADKGCDMVLEGLGVADHHARLDINGDDVSLVPLDGALCYVNDQLVNAEQLVKVGDTLRVGNQRLMVVDPKTQLAAGRETLARTAQANNEQADSTGWYLVALHPKLEGKQFPVNGHCIVGRSKEAAISIPYKLLSREHAELSLQGGKLQLRDLGSSNGTFINGEKIEETLLTGGETVSFAKLSFAVKAPAGQPAVATSGEINKTMLRPAIDLEQELAKITSDKQAVKPAAFEQQAADKKVQAASSAPAKASQLKWVLVATAVLAALGAWWFMR
jgi:pSer/pThr/pTyr-binding forkhead associated (FHA) protein